ncbi:hypothetical protein BaRGS_00010525, partial [Batillaria attramentaria]
IASENIDDDALTAGIGLDADQHVMLPVKLPIWTEGLQADQEAQKEAIGLPGLLTKPQSILSCPSSTSSLCQYRWTSSSGAWSPCWLGGCRCCVLRMWVRIG